MNTIYQLQPREYPIKNALQVIHVSELKCSLKPCDDKAVELFRTRRGCITPAMADLFRPCSNASRDCDGCQVVERALQPGGLLHNPTRTLTEITDRLAAAELLLVEMSGKVNKRDQERIDKAIHFVRDSISHLRKYAPNTGMQATRSALPGVGGGENISEHPGVSGDPAARA